MKRSEEAAFVRFPERASYFNPSGTELVFLPQVLHYELHAFQLGLAIHGFISPCGEAGKHGQKL
jgi:hypothetical protein